MQQIAYLVSKGFSPDTAMTMNGTFRQAFWIMLKKEDGYKIDFDNMTMEKS